MWPACARNNSGEHDIRIVPTARVAPAPEVTSGSVIHVRIIHIVQATDFVKKWAARVRRMKGIALSVCLLLTLAASACRGSSSHAYSGTYLSLGDSIAAGNGASDKSATAFVPLLAHAEGGLDVLNVAEAAATTRDVLDKQLPGVLGGKPKKLAFITISIGGNDLAALIPNTTCQQDPLPATCPLDAALAQVERNVGEIMTRLRGNYPVTPIVVLLYPNFFSGTGHPFEGPAQRVIPRLDEVLGRVAARYPHTALATTAAAFEGKGATVTHVLDPQFDPHPTDAGYRLIADAFIAALKSVK
jgi:lysophospholipase L1-like esterase